MLSLLVRALPLWAAICSATSFDIRTCDQPLGMESGDIPDSAITATSSYVPNVGPQNGRLRVEKAGGAWCPKQQVEKGVREYLQIDLTGIHVITGVQTQGRYDHGRGQEYMEEYTLEYWRPGFDKWKEYRRWDGKQIISGNTDTETVVSHRLMPTVYATKIRILPYSVHRRTVCLRVEIKGCLAGGRGWQPGEELWRTGCGVVRGERKKGQTVVPGVISLCLKDRWGAEVLPLKVFRLLTPPGGQVRDRRMEGNECSNRRGGLKPKFESSKEIENLSSGFVLISLADDNQPKEEKYMPDGDYVPRILFVSPQGVLLVEVINEDGSTEYKYFYSDAESIARSMKAVLKRYPDN